MKEHKDELQELLDGLQISDPAPLKQFRKLVKARKRSFKNIQKMRGNYYGILSMLATSIFFNRKGITFSYIQSMIIATILVAAFTLSALSLGGYFAYKLYNKPAPAEQQSLVSSVKPEMKKESPLKQEKKARQIITIQKTDGVILEGEVLSYDRDNDQYVFRTRDNKIITVKSIMIYKMGNFKVKR